MGLEVVTLLKLGLEGIKILFHLIKEYGSKFYHYLKEKYNNAGDKEDYVESLKNKQDSDENKKDNTDKTKENTDKVTSKDGKEIPEDSSEMAFSESGKISPIYSEDPGSDKPDQNQIRENNQKNAQNFMNSFESNAKNIINEFKGDYNSVSINATFNPDNNNYQFSIDLSGQNDFSDSEAVTS